jgi:hypothetical protein
MYKIPFVLLALFAFCSHALSDPAIPPQKTWDYLGYDHAASFTEVKLQTLPRVLQELVRGLSIELFQHDAYPFAYNPNKYERAPKEQDTDAKIRIHAAQKSGEKDLIELAWSPNNVPVKWIIGQNICCLIAPLSHFDPPKRFEIFMTRTYRLEGEIPLRGPYKVNLPWPKKFKDGTFISSDPSKTPAMLMSWSDRLDIMFEKDVARIITYHRNIQVPGFEPGDHFFSDEFRKRFSKR